MSEQPGPTPTSSQATTFLLSVFAEMYKQELAAEEDVHRTLPFFGTALGIVIGALAYAAGRLPNWASLATRSEVAVYAGAATFLGLAIIEAGLVLVFVSRAIARRDYRRIGPETALRNRLDELQAYYEAQGISENERDVELVKDLQIAILESYMAATPVNRGLNQRRYQFRALASSHLVRSLIWALLATTIMLMADKLSYLPKVLP